MWINRVSFYFNNMGRITRNLESDNNLSLILFLGLNMFA